MFSSRLLIYYIFFLIVSAAGREICKILVFFFFLPTFSLYNIIKHIRFDFESYPCRSVIWKYTNGMTINVSISSWVEMRIDFD